VTIAPEAAVAPLRWTRASMEARDSWLFAAPDDLPEDAVALERWAETQADPVAAISRGAVVLPAVQALAGRVARELVRGTGVAWIRQVPSLPERTLRLVYLALGLELGTTVDTYGRLYDVRDSGASYRDKAIPVSQTRESTGMHTDSSGKHVCPRFVALACVSQAPSGGGSRLVSAAEVHEQLRARHPQHLDRLYGTFVRDVVTPGADRSPERVAENAFPIFSSEPQLKLRYMRYWIERGHERASVPLSAADRAAFDALDAALADEQNVLSFRMAPGDLLFIDNTTVLHDRDAYVDDVATPRLMLRLWLDSDGMKESKP
jgi:alpha-ketoglutarate-dependent taurine dioxygenase